LITLLLAAAVSTSTATFSARETRLYRAAVEATALSERAVARLRVCEESLADRTKPAEPMPDHPAWPSMILGAAGGGIGAAVGWRAFGAAGAFAGASLMAGLFAAVF
jgi:uncharacterized protein YcfJ